ncbi:MAG: ceramide glucosyltransferase, partial [Pseudorhodoplanes sp.]|nr:ceramide glucosyltransferase [Pseudorhodoplanes sp.]
MTAAIAAAAAFLFITSTIHFGSVAVAMTRCRRPGQCLPPPSHAPAVTIVRPVCGLENFIEETLRSSFLLDYPRVEILFCVARADDPAGALAQRLMADYPWIDARLLVGNERISGNPKLNNMFKGWREASHDFVVFADSNVLMPRDYVQRLLAQFDSETGLVCSPPVGSRPDNLWAEVECAFLNGYQARWQILADTVGLGFAQGKTMMWRRADLENAGGIRRLGEEVAEDAASTKVVREAGHKVRIVDAPFPQPLGARALADVWKRQARWAQLRRASFLSFFLPEIMSGALPPLAAAAFLAFALGMPIAATLFIFASLWYGAEMLLAFTAGCPLSPRSLPAAIVRDLMIPPLWAFAWSDAGFVWRGNAM